MGGFGWPVPLSQEPVQVSSLLTGAQQRVPSIGVESKIVFQVCTCSCNATIVGGVWNGLLWA